MSDRHEQATEAIRDSWDFWLSQHDVSVPDRIKEAVRSAWDCWLTQHPVSLGDLIESAVKDAASQWLTRNTDALIDRIGAAAIPALGPGDVRQLPTGEGDMPDPWEPADPDERPDPRTLIAYWKAANGSPAAQRQLVADEWRLWRLARDLADALETQLNDRGESHE